MQLKAKIGDILRVKSIPGPYFSNLLNHYVQVVGLYDCDPLRMLYLVISGPDLGKKWLIAHTEVGTVSPLEQLALCAEGETE